MMGYVQWSWKAIVASVGTFLATLIENNQGEIIDWVARVAAALIVGALTWWKENGPKPS
jgi:hypothetical protein